MIVTLVGKMDGDEIVQLEESERMTMSGKPMVDDVVEVLGRYYKVVELLPDNMVGMKDVTQAFNSAEENNDT